MKSDNCPFEIQFRIDNSVAFTANKLLTAKGAQQRKFADSLKEPLDERTNSRPIDNDAYLNSNSIQDELFVRKQLQRTTMRVNKYSPLPTTTSIPNAHQNNLNNATKISTAPSSTTTNVNDNNISTKNSNNTVNNPSIDNNNNDTSDKNDSDDVADVTIPSPNSSSSKPPPRASSSRVLPSLSPKITPLGQAPLLSHLISTRLHIPSLSESSKLASVPALASTFRMPNQVAASLAQLPYSIVKPTQLLNKSPSFEAISPRLSSNSTVRRPSSALRSTAVVPYGNVPSEMSPWIALPVLVNTTSAQQIPALGLTQLVVYPSQKASFTTNNNIPAPSSFATNPTLSQQQSSSSQSISSSNNIPFTSNLRTVNSTMAASSPTDDTLGCGWDFITNSCKDIFNVNWCTQCHDFGNVFVHNCKCIVRNATPPSPTFLN